MINVQTKSGIVDSDASTIITALGANPSRILGSSNSMAGLEIKEVYLKNPGSSLKKIWPPLQEFVRVLWTVYNGCILLIYAEKSDQSDYSNPTTTELLQEWIEENYTYSEFPEIHNSNANGVILAEDTHSTIINSSEYQEVVNEFKAVSPNILDENQILKFSIVRPTDLLIKFGTNTTNDTFICNTWSSINKKMLVNIHNYSDVEYTHYLLILDEFSYDQMYNGYAEKHWLSTANQNFSIVLDSSYQSLQYGLIKNTSQLNTSVLFDNALFTRLNLTQVAKRESLNTINWVTPTASTTTPSVNLDHYAYSILVSTDGTNFKYPKHNSSYGGGNQFVQHHLPIIFDTGILNININSDQTVEISQTLT